MTTLPVAPLRLKLLLPAMKSALLMLCVVATRPPTSTLEPGAKVTPLGLLMNTWPLALIWPKIWLGLESSTRLSVTLLALGWLKLTRAWLPILKVFQSRAARLLVWLMVSVAALCEIAAWPATTWPPVGSWVGAGGVGGLGGAAPTEVDAAAIARPAAATSTAPDARFPLALAFSATATQAWVNSFQIRRYCLFMFYVPRISDQNARLAFSHMRSSTSVPS